MTTRLTLVAALALGLAGGLLGARFSVAPAAHAQPANADANPERLNILWTSGDPEVAHRVGLMYTHAAKEYGWFPEVRLIVWGPSQRLLVADKDVQAKIAAMRESGVVVEACIACATSYGVVEDLQALGLEVKPMGGPLSDILKNDEHLVTF
jgi:hypothetical protein